MHDDASCEMCRRISLIKKGENPFFVAEMKTGYVVIGDSQKFRGYTLFLHKEHKEELYELAEEPKKEFLMEMSIVAEAVAKAFRPDKLNYELLGNSIRHLHWHIFPRYKNDSAANQPIWVVPKEIRDAAVPSREEVEELKNMLRQTLKEHIPALPAGM